MDLVRGRGRKGNVIDAFMYCNVFYGNFGKKRENMETDKEMGEIKDLSRIRGMS